MNIVQKNYTFYTLSATATSQSTIFEGSLAQYALYLNMTNVTQFNPQAYLVWNSINEGSNQQTNISNDYTNFNDSFTVPASTNGVKNWTWFFNLTGASALFNITGNQTFTAISINNCTTGYAVLNYLVYDEETKALASTNVSIETDLRLTSVYDSSQYWNFILS